MSTMPSSAGTADSRRGGRASHGQPEREIPVLFHLRDVSRPREAIVNETVLDSVSTVTVPESAVGQSVAAPLPPISSAQPVVEPTIEPIAEAIRPPVAEHVIAASQITSLPPPPMAVELSPPSAHAIEAPKPQLASLTNIVAEAIAVSELAPVTSDAKEFVEPISPRERAEQRAQKQQTVQATDNWVRSHGKVLAVGFLVALAGTVFLARMNRRTAEVAGPTIDWPAAHPGDVADHLVVEAPSAAGAAPTPTLTASAGAPTVKADTGSADASPAKLPESEVATSVTAPPTQPRVELLAPTVPSSPVPERPATETAESNPQPSANDLFPWANNETRVATLPDLPRPGDAPPAMSGPGAPNVPAAPHLAPPANAPLGTSPPWNAPPGASPADAGQPSNSLPQAPPFPNNSYREYSQPGPPAMPADAPAAPRRSGYIPMNSSETTPPPGGYRNEPYGSGLY